MPFITLAALKIQNILVIALQQKYLSGNFKEKS